MLSEVPESKSDMTRQTSEVIVRECNSLELAIKRVSQIITEPDFVEISRVGQKESKFYELFYLKAKKNIKLDDFIQRVKKYTKFEDSVFMLSFVIHERVLKKYPILRNAECSIKLLIACIMIASKMTDYDDFFISDQAKVFGIHRSLLITLEDKLFFDILDCRAHVTEQEYYEFQSCLYSLS